MAFQTQAGAQIPIRQLASERAITVKVPNNSDQAAQDQYVPAGSTVIQPRASVSVVVTPENSNPEAGLHLQLTFTVLDGAWPAGPLVGGLLLSAPDSCGAAGWPAKPVFLTGTPNLWPVLRLVSCFMGL